MPKRERAIVPAEVPEWRIRYMIRKLGGVGGTVEKLQAKGFLAPGVNTVQGWSRRGRVPGDWAPALFAIAQDEGIIDTPMEMLISDLHLHPEPKGRRK